MDRRLRQDYGGEFLLQIWSKDRQKKVFQKVVKQRIPYWSQSGNYVIFKEAQDDFFSLVNCQNGCSILKVKDWVKDPSYQFAVMGADKFYLANNHEIQFCFIKDTTQAGHEVPEAVSPAKVHKYSPGKKGKIQSVYAVKNTIKNGSPMVLLEVEDGQLDVNRFVANQEPDGSAKYMLQELTDYAPWLIKNSKIIKVWNLKLTMCASFYALREGGDVDIYVNYDRVCTIKGQKITDIDYDSKNVYFKQENGKIRYIPASLNMKMNWSNSKECSEDFMWDKIILGKVGAFFDPYSTMAFVGDNIYISHSNYVTQYNIVKNFFVHFKFQTQVQVCFKFNPTGIENDFHPYVLTNDGSIFRKFEQKMPAKEIIEVQKFDKTLSYKLRVSGFAIDKQSYKYFFFYGDSKVKLLYLDQLYDVNNIQGMHNKGRIVIAESKEVNLRFIVQDENRIHNYQMYPPKGEVLLNEVSDSKNYVEVDPSRKDNSQLTMGQIHSVAVHPDKRHVLLACPSNIYILKELEQDKQLQITRLKEQHGISAMSFPECKYIYAIKSHKAGQEGGLYLYEGLSIFEGVKDNSFKLTEAQIALKGHIDMNQKEKRIAFMKNLELIEVLPIPHFNTIPFQNFPKRADILCTKRDSEKFSVLTFSGWLYTWKLSDGNLINEIDLKKTLGQPELFKGYVLFAKEESEFTYKSQSQEFALIYHTKPLADVQDVNFYPSYMTVEEFKNQQRFNQTIQKKFHKFMLVRINSLTQIEIVREFDFPIPDTVENAKNADVLHISEDGNFLYEELKYKRVFIYRFKETNGNQGRFELINKLIQFPVMLQPAHLKQKIGIRCIQSPDLTKYLDWDQQEKTYAIYDMLTREKISAIPLSIMNDYGKGLNKSVSHRFKWIDSRYFVCIDFEGIEKKVDTLFNPAQEVTFNRVPSFDASEIAENHFYLARKMLPFVEVKERLVRKYQAYRYASNTLKKTQREDLLDYLIDVDKGYFKDAYSTPLTPEFSFTFLDWRITEEMIHGNIELDSISDERFEQICYNIFPDGSHLLQLAASMASHELLSKLIIKIQEIQKKKKLFEVPFERDFNGNTCLHNLCQSEDLQMIDQLMNFLSQQKIDHHSRTIHDILPKILSLDIPSFVKYMDSRLIETPETKKVTHGDIKAKTSGIGYTSYAIDQGPAINLMLEKQNNEEYQSVNQIVVRLQDVQHLHDFNQQSGDQFMVELSEIKNFQVFDSEAVQNLITFKYRAVQKATVYKLLIPYVISLLIFFIYSDYITVAYREAKKVEENQEAYFGLVVVFQILNWAFAFYFLSNEYRQIQDDGWDYFASFWNYIDLSPPIFIIAATFSFYMVGDQKRLSDAEISLRALACFFMWIKLLYFLRIFKDFGYLIRAIVQVVADMLPFLGVLFLTMFAFGEAFYQISLGNEESFIDAGWAGPINAVVFIYNICLGDFDLRGMSGRVPGLVLLFFLACTLFNMIIMLNLLIAIISKSFEQVDSNASFAGFQEKAKIVSENSYLVDDDIKTEFCREDCLLITAVGKDDLRKAQEEEVQNEDDGLKIERLTQLVNEKFAEILEELRESKKDPLRQSSLGSVQLSQSKSGVK